MKFRTLKNWPDLVGSEGLIFFSQLFEELLFNYSLDTYKPSAMNTPMLCVEALKLVKNIEEGFIDKSNLSHVLDELLQNLSKDEVAKALLSLDIHTISRKFNNPAIPILEIATILELIFGQIKPSKYKAKTEQLLLDAITNPNQKNRIRALTRSYTTTLINLGYSTDFLYPTARMYFHLSPNKISCPKGLQGFIDIVSAKPQEYIAIFKVNALFDEINDSCEVFHVQALKALPKDVVDLVKIRSFVLGKDEIFLVLKDIQAMDVFSARSSAERRIEQIATLYSLFHHKEVAAWNRSALLINLETGKNRIVPASHNPMLMCADSKREDVAIKLSGFIKNFSLERNSFEKFNRSAELHSLALRSDSPENQLLNLWVALETIVPSKAAQVAKAKINNIIDSVLPFLSLTYVESLTDRLVADFSIWNRRFFNSAIEGVEGDNDRDRMLRLLILDDFKDRKNRLFSDLRDFHLLRNRAYYFSEELASPSKILKMLNAHWQRVDWQIRRIYRTRNLIVHAGDTPLYTGILIKNTHDYLDIVLKTIGKLASEDSKVNTIDGAFKYVELRYQEYKELLSSQNGKVTEANIMQLLIRTEI
ncbi:hypothetical protein [Polynucleobacter yangtzensis]|uniref:hypothetical protein n=1 Tax=Polynucleobacter yangtzensis TaxID=1743159 RepID=UPI00082DEB2C|nr:hypothetical protein [Polynucleobacter yangtzensis]